MNMNHQNQPEQSRRTRMQRRTLLTMAAANGECFASANVPFTYSSCKIPLKLNLQGFETIFIVPGELHAHNNSYGG